MLNRPSKMASRCVAVAFMASVYHVLVLSAALKLSTNQEDVSNSMSSIANTPAYPGPVPSILPPALPPPPCGENEITSYCSNNHCVKRLCDEKEPESDCKFEDNCIEGCLCKEGHLRAQNGTCVPGNQCPKPIVCGDNEVYFNCINGGCFKRSCSDEGRAILCIDLIAGACTEGCMCRSDYLRAKNGSCVPIEECPKEEVCSKPHEYYDRCEPSCPSRDCRYYETETECPPQLEVGDPNCYASCRCEEGYYRNFNQDCVPKEDCSKFCFGLNEFLEAYPKSCEPQTCDKINKPFDITQTCNSECRCYPGFVRNKHGECIKEEDCGKCQGPNEYYGCNSPCDNVCSTLDKMNQTNCPITPDWYRCVEKCYCDEGYARDSNNICIPIEDCPDKENKAE